MAGSAPVSPLNVRKGGITDIEGGGDSSKLGRQEKRALFVQLRAKGHSYSAIASRLAIGKSTLANWSKEMEAEIASLKAIELEALYEEAYLLKEGRIRLLAGWMDSLRAELDKRSLEDVATDKLMEILLRVYGELKAEYREVAPLSGQEISRLQGQSWTESER